MRCKNDKDWGQLIQNYGFRLYNPSIGKFLSVDPLAPEYPWYTPYQFAGNMPIKFIDVDGLEPGVKGTVEGQSAEAPIAPPGDFHCNDCPLHTWRWHGGSDEFSANWYSQAEYYNMFIGHAYTQKFKMGAFFPNYNGGSELANFKAEKFDEGFFSENNLNYINNIADELYWADFWDFMNTPTPKYKGLASGRADIADDPFTFAFAGGFASMATKGTFRSFVSGVAAELFIPTLRGQQFNMYKGKGLYNVGKGKNLAILKGNIYGDDLFIYAASGDAIRPGMIGNPSDRLFTTFEVSGFSRAFDSEAKLLEYLGSKYKTGSKGKITIISQFEVCPSCNGVIQQFTRMFPEVKTEIIDNLPFGK